MTNDDERAATERILHVLGKMVSDAFNKDKEDKDATFFVLVAAREYSDGVTECKLVSNGDREAVTQLFRDYLERERSGTQTTVPGSLH